MPSTRDDMRNRRRQISKRLSEHSTRLAFAPRSSNNLRIAGGEVVGIGQIMPSGGHRSPDDTTRLRVYNDNRTWLNESEATDEGVRACGSARGLRRESCVGPAKCSE